VRALHAALGMQRAFAAYAATLPQPHGTGLTLRLGVHTGPVEVSAISPDLQLAYTAPGATIAAATGLQQLCRDGAIVLSTAVQQQASGFFRFTTIGTHRLPGLAEAVDVCICEGVAPVTSRLGGAWPGIRPFRDTQEHRCWKRGPARDRPGGLPGGRTGVGKSRRHDTAGLRRRPLAHGPLSYGRAMPSRRLLFGRCSAWWTRPAQRWAIRTRWLDPAWRPTPCWRYQRPVPRRNCPHTRHAAAAPARLLPGRCNSNRRSPCAAGWDAWLDPSSQELLDLPCPARRPFCCCAPHAPAFIRLDGLDVLSPGG
jgi:hypothetical protein